MKGSKPLFIASCVILLLLSLAVILGSIGSIYTAYSGPQDNLTPSFTLEEVRPVGGDEVVNALRGRRVTAATWALSSALLALWVVVIPYRRAERWTWWALLVSLGLPQLISLGRALVFGSTFGTGTSATILTFLLLGLLMGVPRIFSRRGSLN